MEQKDGDGSKDEDCKILDFVGQQCLWPAFSEKTRQTDKTTGETVKGIGTMLSNAKSDKPCSFLPKVFELMKTFEQCLAGQIEWRTASLCKEPEIMAPASQKKKKNPKER